MTAQNEWEPLIDKIDEYNNQSNNKIAISLANIFDYVKPREIKKVKGVYYVKDTVDLATGVNEKIDNINPINVPAEVSRKRNKIFEGVALESVIQLFDAERISVKKPGKRTMATFNLIGAIESHANDLLVKNTLTPCNKSEIINYLTARVKILIKTK